MSLYRVEVQFEIQVFNVDADSPEEARDKVIDEEDIPINACVSKGELIR
jgi:hypothetical protein